MLEATNGTPCSPASNNATLCDHSGDPGTCSQVCLHSCYTPPSVTNERPMSSYPSSGRCANALRSRKASLDYAIAGSSPCMPARGFQVYNSVFSESFLNNSSYRWLYVSPPSMWRAAAALQSTSTSGAHLRSNFCWESKIHM